MRRSARFRFAWASFAFSAGLDVSMRDVLSALENLKVPKTFWKYFELIYPVNTFKILQYPALFELT